MVTQIFEYLKLEFHKLIKVTFFSLTNHKINKEIRQIQQSSQPTSKHMIEDAQSKLSTAHAGTKNHKTSKIKVQNRDEFDNQQKNRNKLDSQGNTPK